MLTEINIRMYMKLTMIVFMAILTIPLNALAQSPTRITFSVDSGKNKTDAIAITKIERAAKQIIKQKCPKKTKFYSTAISINVGRVNDNTYTANANYTGECKYRK